MKKGIIIQARTTSTRLPGKILKELPFGSGITVLEQVIRRCKKSSLCDEIIIATTTDTEDDLLIEVAEKENVIWFRGSRDNVLERYYKSASDNYIDVIVRICSDCPCIEPLIIDNLIKFISDTGADYVYSKNFLPFGVAAIEVFTFKSIKKAYQNSTETYEKEHVTPYIYRSRPELFRIKALEIENTANYSDIRLVLDTEEDYTLLCTVYDYLYKNNNFFNKDDIIKLFKEKPWLKLINKKIAQKKIFNNLQEELEEALKILNLQELKKAENYIKNLQKV